jgi:hypothetical protein
LGEGQYIVWVLADDRVEDIEVKLTVLMRGEISESNHSLQAVSQGRRYKAFPDRFNALHRKYQVAATRHRYFVTP